MFVLQVNPLYLSALGQPEALVAVARSEDIDNLSAFVQLGLSLAEDGVTIKHWESTTTLPTGSSFDCASIPCMKMFRQGSPLEHYTTPVDRDMLIVDLGTMEQRIEDLTAELVSRVTADWTQILDGVVEILNLETAQSLSASDL